MTSIDHNAPGIGSDFESLKDATLTDPITPPWEIGLGDAVYTETGRQALAIIARVLSARGVDTIFVPEYLCESMVQPFHEAGWRIDVLPMSEELRLIGEVDVRQLRERGARSAVLLATYFGRLPDRNHVWLAESARDAGAVVIEDETHRVLTPGGVFADIAFGSLRKTLPLADGAYLHADPEISEQVRNLAPGDSERWLAMDAKRENLLEGVEDDSRSMFARANATLEVVSRERQASDRTIRTLQRLPFHEFAETRRENASALSAALSGSQVKALSDDDGGVPSHLVVSVQNPVEVQRKMAEQRIYCPIHWPRVDVLSSQSSWRSDLLSLPVDHRYTPTDMMRVAHALREIVAS